MQKRKMVVGLVVFMFTVCLCCLCFAASVIRTGTCGENVTWRLYDDGELEISGNGAMDDFDDHSPWVGNEIIEVNILDGVTSIGNCAFYDCHSLISVEISDSVTSIGRSAFESCSSLEYCSIPSNVRIIGENAFNGCNYIKDLVIPEGVTAVEKGTFANCWNLTTVSIPDSVMSIGDEAFDYCLSLQDISMSASITKIGEKAFCYTSLKHVDIPEKVEKIGPSAFEHCFSLERIEVDSMNKCYSSIDGVLFDKAQTEVLAYPAAKGESYRIPDGVIKIGKDAFYDCKELKEIVLPTSIEVIGDYAFCGCDGLKKISIPDSVISINQGAFSHCESLTNVTIPHSVSHIATCTFEGCSRLRRVYIPEGIKSIGNSAFSMCDSLKSIYIPNGVTEIAQYAFDDCKKLKEITIPQSIKNIKFNAFHGCVKLEDVYYSGDKSQRAKIQFGKNNKNIIYATWHYGSDSELADPETESDASNIIKDGMVFTLDSEAKIAALTDINNRSITTLTIPSKVKDSEGNSYKVTTIDDEAIKGCKQLSSLVVGNNIISIGKFALKECDALKKITIKSMKLDSIGKKAFAGISDGAIIKCPKKLKESYESMIRKAGVPDSVTFK